MQKDIHDLYTVVSVRRRAMRGRNVNNLTASVTFIEKVGKVTVLKIMYVFLIKQSQERSGFR